MPKASAYVSWGNPGSTAIVVLRLQSGMVVRLGDGIGSVYSSSTSSPSDMENLESKPWFSSAPPKLLSSPLAFSRSPGSVVMPIDVVHKCDPTNFHRIALSYPN